MKIKNDKLISEITVRLKRADNNFTIGTGILYYNDNLNDKIYLLTASHCLFENGENFQQKFNSICIDIYDPFTTSYKTIVCNNIDENLLLKETDNDVAIIVLDKEEVDSINSNLPKVQIVRERQTFNLFYIKGFPQATKGKELAAVQSIWIQEMTETKRFQLQLNADYTEHHAKGFSGAGIFLEANNEIYLYGIFTRYREEEKGKVIYCQYIDSINDLLRKNFLPQIAYTYLGENGLSPLFFANQIEQEVNNLGPRFNEDLNFELSIAKNFNSVSKTSEYCKNIVQKTDKWLTEREYRKSKDNVLLAEIEAELETLRQEIKNWVIEFQSINSVKIEITLLPLTEKVQMFNKKVSGKWHEIFSLSTELREGKDKSKESFDTGLSRLREIQKANHELIDNIDDLNINLANHPTLIIKGEAGCGKSHLLGDIATQRKKQNLPTILLLGTTFTNTTIERNILEKLNLTCTYKNFIESLNSIGLQINSRILILIDAINEGAGTDLWKNQIAGFVHEVAKFPAVGLVMTIRSTYYNDIIPANFESNPNITIITHEGFKGNEYEALKMFCKHYKIRLPDFPILNPEFSNPLFLEIICNAIKDLPDKSFPKGFTGINKTYSLYKQFLNRKFEEKRKEYKYQDIVSKAIEKISFAIFNAKYHSISIAEAVKLFNSEFSRFPFLLSDLIEECVLMKMRDEYDRKNPTEIVFFSYQKLGDFFMSEELLKQYETKEKLFNAFSNDTAFKKITNEYQWIYNGIIEAFSILLPEKYGLEIFELIDFFIEKNGEDNHKDYLIRNTYECFCQILFDSLKWREISNIDEEKITNWLNKNGKYIIYDNWFYTLTELSAIPNHPFNGDRLHKILMRCSMPERDSFLQKYLLYYNDHNDHNIAFPLRRLIDWAWSPDISYTVDSETARLVAQTLAWVLSTTDIALRDQTTKALVNLLEQQPEVLIKTLTAFDNIDDLYISERLYAVTYGCILRTEKDDSIKIIAQYVYNVIFKNGNPPTHILLRDYARNIVEYAICKNIGLDINADLIRPPYYSAMPILPEKEDDVKMYELDYNSSDFKQNHGFEHNAIYSSLISGIADFGHYIVESTVDDFSSFSFKEDENYNNYLKTLKRAQKEFIELLYKCIKQETAFHKNNDYQKRMGIQWGKSQQAYIDMLDSTKNHCMNELNRILNQDQVHYVKETILPYFERKLNVEKFNPYLIRYWIVKRVFELGYDRKIHGEYDGMVQGFYRHENKTERIGKKYQWIAFYEILAMLADNYKIKSWWNSDDKYHFYKGAWQLSIRSIDPAYITKNKDEEDEDSIKKNIKEWWDDAEYTHWDYPDSEWVQKSDDLVDPKQIIKKKDNNEEEWLHLQHFVEWKEPKKIGKERYEGRWKNLCYIIQGCLVKKADKQRIVNYLKKQNFWGRWLPENRDDHSYLINREKFWSPAYIDTYKNDKKIWDTIRDTKYKVIIATESANGGIENDKSGANRSYNIPCKYLFKGMKLQYAPIDGTLKNVNGEVIVLNSNPKGILMRKKDLIKFLDDNNLDIIWTLLGEKFSFTKSRDEESYFKVPCGVYYFEDGKLNGELKMYDRN